MEALELELRPPQYSSHMLGEQDHNRDHVRQGIEEPTLGEEEAEGPHVALRSKGSEGGCSSTWPGAGHQLGLPGQHLRALVV